MKNKGGSSIFLGGGALVSCSTSTPTNHIVFFLQNTSCIRKRQVIWGEGGRRGCAPPDPPPRSAPEKEQNFSYTLTFGHHMIQVTFMDLESKSPSEILACDDRRSFFPFSFGGEGLFFLLSPPLTLSAKNRTPDR